MTYASQLASITTAAADARPDGEADDLAAVGERCPACPHLVADHDPLGARFCAATTAASLTRGCVCV